MLPLQETVFSNDKDAYAQHQTSLMEMVTSNVFYIVSSSKGVSLVILARWLGVSQSTAWKMGHAIRAMMNPGDDKAPPLTDIVELDEKYLGGKPRYQQGVQHKRGKGTTKQ